MKGMRLLAGIILFGSIWGLMECVIGDYLHNAGLFAGSIMTGFVAFGLMAISRRIYGIRGMQLGMGLVAGLLKYIHPVGGCMLCSAIAIAFEGMIFEMIWYSPRINIDSIKRFDVKLSMGIISGYVIYAAGYIITQILTPVAASASFYVSDLMNVVPKILSTSTIAGLAGGVTIMIVLSVPHDLASRIVSAKKEIYYPVASLISVICWVSIVILS